MDSRVKKAVMKHRSGYNCSQAVACAFCNEVGISEELMCQLMEGYGFGMGCMEGVCGALSGAIAIASLKVNQTNPFASNRRREIYNISKEILKGFQKKNQSIICKELKGLGSGKVLRECSGCVADAAELLESTIFGGNYMQITDAAKKIISDALEAEQCDGIHLYTTRSCCGQSLNFELVKIGDDEKTEMINGLSVLMDDDTRQWTGTVTIDVEGERLTLLNSASCCS